MKILLVEDDESIASLLHQALKRQNYLVDLAPDGYSGWELAESFAYDLILLDLVLPKLDGISFCQRLRQNGDRTPILLLTAQDTVTKKVQGLDAGADDYVVKPFIISELLARIRALLRRGGDNLTPILEWRDVQLDQNTCQVSFQGNVLKLTPKEYALMELFLRNPQRIFSQNALLDHLWSFAEPPSENAVRTQIKGLRQKLRQAGAPSNFIETVYGLGYRLNCEQQQGEDENTSKPANLSLASESITATGEGKNISKVPSTLEHVWQRHKEKYLQRIHVLQQAAEALQTGNLSQELQQQASQEAHTLAGSLGSFGFLSASRTARQIEKVLLAPDNSSEEVVVHLAALVLRLYQEIKSDPPTSTTKPLPLNNLYGSQIQEQRLLIIDDDLALAQVFAAEASTWGMITAVAGSLSEARVAIAQHQPDVVLLDLCLSDSCAGGFELLAELSMHQAGVPVIVFTAQESFADRIRVARLGAKGFLHKPITTKQVMQKIAQVLQPDYPTLAKLMIVDDDTQILDLLRTLLEPWGFQLILLENPEEFWHTLELSSPDLLILDVEMPQVGGIELCQVVRNDPHWQDLPILFLSAHQDIELVQTIFNIGADDYLRKPILAPELVARIFHHLAKARYRSQWQGVDQFTGLTVRAQAIPEMNRLLNLAKRQGKPWCLILIDIDRYDKIIAQYGRKVGEKALKYLVKLLQEEFRREDLLVRWDSKHLVMGLYDMTRSVAVTRLTSLLDTFCQYEFSEPNQEKLLVSFSAGVGEYPRDGTQIPALYQTAKMVLSQAQARGGKQVVCCSAQQ